MSMKPGKVFSIGTIFLCALAADYVRTKLVGSYDFPEDNTPETNPTDKEKDDANDS